MGKELWFIPAKIQIESKSQRIYLRSGNIACCDSSLQKYKLKANHNKSPTHLASLLLWFIPAKIQIESKSQHWPIVINRYNRCDSSLQKYKLKANHNLLQCSLLLVCAVIHPCKNTNWKQITTFFVVLSVIVVLWFIPAKIQIESKSQLSCR